MWLKSLSIKNYKCFTNEFVINFKQGKLSCILGSNGSGKSTILEVLSIMKSRYLGQDAQGIDDSIFKCVIIEGANTAKYMIEYGVECFDNRMSNEIIRRFFDSIEIMSITNTDLHCAISTSTQLNTSRVKNVLFVNSSKQSIYDYLESVDIRWMVGRESPATKVIIKIIDCLFSNTEKIIFIDGFGLNLNEVTVKSLLCLIRARKAQTVLTTCTYEWVGSGLIELDQVLYID